MISCFVTLLKQVGNDNKHGILLEVVQVLTNLNFIVTKADIIVKELFLSQYKSTIFCFILMVMNLFI
ncbi:hypothetical protein HanHA300_Chr05g0174081 [Helianthus annuus]|nr:hypothetical protein HanHA300_Chr05g0174081 [Helianthus annuus]KAJ0584415.1 hypothetical protein HanHA89_Chr05g0188371 [Helianthus annuus]KAJ0747042.1 hypothetical protein HanOQP8_Chr05g0184931 [Helianthus annuus]